MEALVYFVLPVILLILGLPVFVVFDRDMHEVARFIEHHNAHGFVALGLGVGEGGRDDFLSLIECESGHKKGCFVQRGFLSQCPSSPMMPRRKAKTQTTKMNPCTMVTHEPSSAK